MLIAEDGLASLDRLPTTTERGVASVRALDLFGQRPAPIVLPLNRKTTESEIKIIPLAGIEPRASFVSVEGLKAYLAKPRKDAPDVAHLTMRDGSERWILQEGHTRLGAAKLSGETERECRVWEFRENERGGFDPVPRGLHRRGLTYRERLLALGDFPGHPFRGNQYTDAPGDGGGGGGPSGSLTKARQIPSESVDLVKLAQQGDTTGNQFTRRILFNPRTDEFIVGGAYGTEGREFSHAEAHAFAVKDTIPPGPGRSAHYDQFAVHGHILADTPDSGLQGTRNSRGPMAIQIDRIVGGDKFEQEEVAHQFLRWAVEHGATKDTKLWSLVPGFVHMGKPLKLVAPDLFRKRKISFNSYREYLMFLLGDFDGHPFRGNQYTAGEGRDVSSVSERILNESGGKLAVLDLRPKANGDVELETMAVAKGQGNQGAGTRAMESLTAWADREGVRLVLSPSQKGYQPVEGGPKTTSSERLKAFYKRFGFVDPTSKRYYDPTLSSPTKPMLYRVPKKLRKLDYRARLALLLGDYEGHPFRGNQWVSAGEGGAEDPQGYGSVNVPSDASESARTVARVAYAAASRMGFDESKIDVIDVPPVKFQVAGRDLTEGGHYSPETGRITINAASSGETQHARGLATHEVMHAQHDTLERVSQDEHEEISRIAHADDHSEFDRLFGKNGYPRASETVFAEIEARWPASALRAKHAPNGDAYLGTWKQGDDGKWRFDDDEHMNRRTAMRDEDGATAYSKLYWEQEEKQYGSPERKKASFVGRASEQETLAEVARYHEMAARGPWKEGVPGKRWQAYAMAIKKAYPDMKKRDTR